MRRVDEGLGLLLELPAPEGAPALAPGYAHISNLADERVPDLGRVRCAAVAGLFIRARCWRARGSWLHLRGERRVPACASSAAHPPHLPTSPTVQFRAGQRVRARVLGFRPLDGLAVLTLKPSTVDQHILSLAGALESGRKKGPSVGWPAGCTRLPLAPVLDRRCSPPSHAALAELRPGQPVQATVSRVEDYGLLVAITPTIRCGLAAVDFLL